ncbi:MAG: hypothetical protein HRT61_08450 [Ekhidna sp.]|nr:hypothetical protein [Ekhidna sp.]
MRKITKNLLLLLMAFSVLTIVSCSDDEEEVFGGDDPNDPVSEFDARLNTAASDSLSATVFLTDVDDNKVDVFISFSSSDATMRRLYSTVNVQDQGEEAYELPLNADKKADGSLELDGPQGDAFAVNLDIATSGLPSEGTVVYKFWTTTGRGDYRDPSKRDATPVMTLTIQVTGVNPDRTLTETTGVQLDAPLGDASSNTFTSNVDCQTYKISDGEEFAAFWDFGFYYLPDEGISLASTESYPALFANPSGDGLVSVNAFLGIDETEVNKCYFAAAPAGTYDGATVASLQSSGVSTSSPQEINNLAVGDEVYLLDQYGKRGILKVTGVVESFGSDGLIGYDIKIEK